jgi:hypothetical protein
MRPDLEALRTKVRAIETHERADRMTWTPHLAAASRWAG